MPTPFSTFDQRGYRTTDVRSGYAEWAATYEHIVEDAMDIDLLRALETPQWSELQPAIDLGCGTGRTGRWLAEQGVSVLDGVDLTPEMLERARLTGAFRNLAVGDVSDTGYPSATYQLATMSLVDEHLADLGPLYREAQRLVLPGGYFVMVGFHPHFIMSSGMPTHFTNSSGEHVAIETHVHLISEHITAALSAGWTLVEMRERIIDDVWLQLKPKWAAYRGHPIAMAFVWQRQA